LARRDHASGELRRKLRDKGFDPALVDELIEKLRAEKLLDDRRYLENYVAYHASRGHGPNRVRADLCKRGIGAAESDPILGAYPDWSAQLNRARQKKFGTSPPNNYAQIREALGLDVDVDVDVDTKEDDDL
jgi:regulatory protein